jgi:hypothetical protein
VADGSAREGGGEAAAPAVGLAPGVPDGAVHDGDPVRLRQRGALEEPERRERRVVGVVPRQVVDVPLRRRSEPAPRPLGAHGLSSPSLAKIVTKAGGRSVPVSKAWGRGGG